MHEAIEKLKERHSGPQHTVLLIRERDVIIAALEAAEAECRAWRERAGSWDVNDCLAIGRSKAATDAALSNLERELCSG